MNDPSDSSPIIDPDDPPPSDQYPTLWDDGRRDDDGQSDPSTREPNSLWDVVVGLIAGYSLIGSSTLLDWVKAKVKRKRDEVNDDDRYDD